MRVLMWINSGSEIPGGHRVQLQQTARALRALGVEVDEHDGPFLPDGDWDIVHGFQLSAGEVAQARQQGFPVAMSTIYVGLAYGTAAGGGGPTLRDGAGRTYRGMRYLRASLRGREPLTRLATLEMEDQLDRMRAWSMADVLLPNAEGEARHIRDDLGVLTQTSIVPNAIDARLFAPGFDRPRLAGTVLSVGRIEPHKGQLAVIEALRGLPDVTLTIVGPTHPHHREYANLCRTAATDNVTLLSGVEHNELPDLYARHHTHVLASWYETTGLVSLEAAASGCTIVTTDRGHAREYLGDDARYCDPADPATIRQTTLAALGDSASASLRDRVTSQFTWEDTARATLAAYERVVALRGPRTSAAAD
ncbi:glycosyltransferase family 4 protein [Janibacter limosus]|uniref:Glycosyltransferase n=1 Tax=Janibacter limosus TaxID=53458 RepID=A0A4P6MPJ5_9MICO|nr:glycosyltransferase family 4 protein [Janibacter limosus]QBF45284.1 glycosyltransferase [Janibacter limosus]